MRTFNTDLARFKTAGYGTLRGDDVGTLHVGDLLAVTDNEADTYEAEVLAVDAEAAQVHVRWDRVLHQA
jgi:hypothetical protein